MKRTSMNRRTAMRRKRKTPRSYVDETLRRSYMDANKQDELLRYFPRFDAGIATVELDGYRSYVRAFGTDSCETHHIAGGANGADRWDLVTNLAAVCRLTHRWCERFRPEGFILGMRLKIDKGEWDDETMRETVLGLRRPGASVLSYLSIRKPQFEWVQDILDGLIEELEAEDEPS